MRQQQERQRKRALQRKTTTLDVHYTFLLISLPCFHPENRDLKQRRF